MKTEFTEITKNEKCIVLSSGGMDSTTLVYLLKSVGCEPFLLSFNYNQRHGKELKYSKDLAVRLQLNNFEFDLRGLGELGGSVLTNMEKKVPEGHYTKPSMVETIVPSRNTIFISIGIAFAVKHNMQNVYIAAHAGDHPIYPDCRPSFIEAMNNVSRVANNEAVNVIAPFLNKKKQDICTIGSELKVPWEKTWSCYNGREHHCGVCGTCVERKEAFFISGVKDPTVYEDAYK